MVHIYASGNWVNIDRSSDRRIQYIFVTTSPPSSAPQPKRPPNMPTFYDSMAMDLSSIVLDSPVVSRFLFLLSIFFRCIYHPFIFIFLICVTVSICHGYYFSMFMSSLFYSILFHGRLVSTLCIYLHIYRSACWEAFILIGVLKLC